MADAILALAATGLAGLSPSAAVIGLRYRDAQRWAADLDPYRLEVGHGFDPEGLRQFLGALTGLLPARWERPVAVRGLGVEIVATDQGITHWLLVPRHQSEIVLGQLRAAVPSARVTAESLPRWLPPTLAGEVVTDRPHQPLKTGEPETVAAGLLSALQPLAQDEQMVVQILLLPLAPRTAPSLSTSPNDHELSGRTAEAIRTKYSDTLFAGTIRLAVTSPSAARDRQLLARLTASLHFANSPHANLRRRAVSSRNVARALLARKPLLLGRRCLLSAAEVTGLVGLPPRHASLPGLSLGGTKLLAPSVDIPTHGLVVADANFPGISRPLALSTAGSQQHVHIVGPTGVGKSVLLANLVLQAIAAGWAVVVIDPKSDLVADLLLRIAVRSSDVIVFDPLDSRPVGLNVLHGPGGDPDRTAEDVFTVIAKLNRDSWGPRLADLLRASLHTLARTPGTTLVDLPRLLTDPIWRQRVIGDLDDPLGLGAVWGWWDSLSDAERGVALSPLLNKVRPWVVRPRLRHVLGQAEPLLDLDQALADRRIILAPLSSGELGSDAAALLATVLLSKLFQAVMRRVRFPREERHPVLLVVDEAQMVAGLPTPLPDLLAMARAMGVAVVLAHQTLSQFDPELRAAVQSAARSRVIFQSSATDARPLARDLQPYLEPEDLQALGRFEVVARLATGERVAPPATGRTRPLPEPTADAAAIREQSRQLWGRDRADVEAELRRRQEAPATPGGSVGRRPRRSP